MPRISKEKVERIRARIEKGETFREIAQAENTSNNTIQNVINGEYDNIKTPTKKKEGSVPEKKIDEKLANKNQSDGFSSIKTTLKQRKGSIEIPKDIKKILQTDKEFLRRILNKANHRRAITIEEKNKADKILEEII